MCSVVTQELPQASVSYRSKLYHIHNERSISGTYVNGKKIKKGETRKLKHKDEIKLTDKERRVPMVFLLNSKLKVHGRMKKIMLDLTRSQLAEINKIDEEIGEIESKKSCLEKKNARLEAELNFVGRKRMRLSIEVMTAKKQKDEVEEIEEKINDEEEKTPDVELKIGKFADKGKELQQVKRDMEIRHKKEREELGSRWQAEINILKQKLADSERETKKNGKSQKNKDKLNLTRKLLLRSELEQYSICEEKFDLKPQEESNITYDLTKDNADTVVIREMEKKLKEKEEAEEKQKKDIAELEEELLCSICAEILFEPKVLNCGHLFCKFCIKEWTKSRNSCPVCRTTVKTCIRIHSIDSIIDKNIAMISDAAKERRKQLIKERSRVAVVRPTKRIRCCHSILHSPRQFTSTTNMHNSPPTGLVMRLNQQDQGIIVFSQNRTSNDVWNVSTNDQGERVYRYYVHDMRNSRPAAATAPVDVMDTDSTNAPAFPEAAQPQGEDGPTSPPVNLIDLTDQ